VGHPASTRAGRHRASSPGSPPSEVNELISHADNPWKVPRSEANTREGSCRSSAAFLPGLWSPAALGSALIERASTDKRLAPWTAGVVQRALSSLASREGHVSAIPAPDERVPGYTGAIPRTAEGGRLGLALVVIASAQLMVVLDGLHGQACRRSRLPSCVARAVRHDGAAGTRRSRRDRHGGAPSYGCVGARPPSRTSTPLPPADVRGCCRRGRM